MLGFYYKHCTISNIHEKILNSDWLSAVQYFRNIVQTEKKETQCKFLNFLNFLFSKFLNFLISKCDLRT